MTSNRQYPLTPTQEGMLYHWLLRPDSEAYQVQLAFEFAELDSGAFAAAWHRLAARHIVFRTHFAWRDGQQPMQVIAPPGPLDWNEWDLRSLGAEAAQQRWEAWLRSDRVRPFDLASLPLMRMTLAHDPSGMHRFVWTFPHLLLDGWSLSVLWDELQSLYTSATRGQAIELPEPPNLDLYFRWLGQQDRGRADEFWKSQLAGLAAPSLLQHAVGHFADSGEHERFQYHCRQLSLEPTAALVAQCRRHRVTLNSAVLGSWAIVLGRYCGSSDVVFGTLLSGRPPQLEGMERWVGMLVNTLPLRVRIDSDQEFWATVAGIQSTQLSMREFEYASLADVQRQAALPPRLPLFDTLVIFENHPAHPTGLKSPDALKILQVHHSDPAHYPLSLVVGRQEDRLLIRITHREGCFSPTTIQGLADDLVALLAEAASPASRTLGQLGSSLRRGTTFAAEPVPQPVTWTLDQIFDQYLEQSDPQRVAVISDHGEVTFGRLRQHCDELACRLQQAGVGAEIPVGILLPRSLDSIVSMLAILRAGGAIVPLDPNAPDDWLGQLIKDAGIEVIIAQRPVAEDALGVSCKWIVMEESSHQFEGGCMGQLRPACNHADRAAYVLYTSGSTGRPKGVVGTHRGLIHRLRWMWERFPFEPGERVAHRTSLCFVDSLWEVFGPLLVGTPVVLISEDVLLDPPQLIRSMRRHHVTRLVITPTLLRPLLEAGGSGELDLPGCQLWTSSGEPLTPDLVRAFFSRLPRGRLLNLYGSTEVAADVTWYDAGQLPIGALHVPIGKPLDHVRVHVLDESMQPTPPGVVGEIHVGGECLARGYWKQPVWTAEHFVPDPLADTPGARMYRSGDLARVDRLGNLEYVGRRDAMRKLRGIRIEPAGIEAQLQSHPAVREAVVDVESSGDHTQLVAYVVLRQRFDDEPQALRRHLRKLLPEYLVPSVWRIVDAMPVGPTGKLDRQRLHLARQLDCQPPSAPRLRSGWQQRITRVWAEVLGLDHVDPQANFLDLGGHSLLLLRLRNRLSEVLGHDFRLLELMEHPTVESMAEHAASVVQPSLETPEASHCERAVGVRAGDRRDNVFVVIGMSGRFPQSPNLAAFWRHLCEGHECRSEFSDEELLAQGISRRLLEDSSYVKSGFVLDDIELFDASFFGFSPREAEILDPQHRLALECAWEALEHAGYDPQQYDGRIGLFAGASMSGYLINNVLPLAGTLQQVGYRQAMFGSVPDYLVTRVSYKLNLTGPSCFVQTACSTSLVAVHLACQSLRNREADLVLAGGVSAFVPQRAGYVAEQGGMESPDGHCYAFDARARGTVFGSGAGLVALKRLGDALDDGDQIHALILGSAINNDGSLKVGFTAPSVAGQAEVIRAALAAADVPAASIDYIEAHGTGTELGDPIEVAALNRALGGRASRANSCAIGSLKPNIGHLDAAAGISGLLKVVLALQHQQLPPSIHFESANPKIDFDDGPLYVNTRLRPWPRGSRPRRAGISSFGFGGTNAHVILEEPPELPVSATTRSHHLLIVSARTAAALNDATANLAAHFRSHRDVSLADAAYTLQVGRHAFAQRRTVVCQSVDEAIEKLESLSGGGKESTSPAAGHRPVVFMFPGQGTQHVHMAAALYREQPAFRSTVEECCRIVDQSAGVRLGEMLYPASGQEVEMNHRLRQTSAAQLALLVIEIALARLWISWGIQPDACIGHSIGEFAAAHLAGVFSLEEVLQIVATRGRLMERMPLGAMLVVLLPAETLVERMAAEPGMVADIAAINAPAACVLSGTHEAIDGWQQGLTTQGLVCKRLATSHAFHSHLMDGAVDPLVQFIAAVPRQPPQIPYISNVTGDWVTAQEWDDPAYWGRQLRRTVQFSAGIQRLLNDPQRLFLEVGPGQTLRQLAAAHLPLRSDRCFACLPHAGSDASDAETMLEALGSLWRHGLAVDWRSFHDAEPRRRVVLPGYPFERKRYWIQPPRQTPASARRMLAEQLEHELSDSFFVPSWTRQSRTWRAGLRRPGPARPARAGDAPSPLHVLYFAEGGELGQRLEDQLRRACSRLVIIAPAGEFAEPRPGCFTVRPDDRADYRRLWQTLRERGELPAVIVHGWCLRDRPSQLSSARPALQYGFNSLIALAQSFADSAASTPARVLVFTRGLHDVAGNEAVDSIDAPVLGACRVIPQEYASVQYVNVDMAGRSSEISGMDLDQAMAVLQSPDASESVVAIRHGACWQPAWQNCHFPAVPHLPRRLRPGGVYLITGGLGGVGSVLGKYLAQSVRARLVLTSRGELPPRDSWPHYLRAADASPRVRQRIERVQELEAAGAEVWVTPADVCDRSQMDSVIAQTIQRYGRLDGVIHAAGIAGGGMIALKTSSAADAVLAPKLDGTIHLGEILRNHPLDFFLLTSSITSILGQVGQVDYAAANAFLDAFARQYRQETGIPTIAINWSAWREVGMAVETEVPPDLQLKLKQQMLVRGIRNADAVQAFARILEHCEEPQVAVSFQDLAELAAQPRERFEAAGPQEESTHLLSRELKGHPRPPLTSPFEPPRSPLERTICNLWSDMLGIDPIGINDSFFDLGGHSLLAVQVMTRVNQALGTDLPVARLYEGLTVKSLASLIEGGPPLADPDRAVMTPQQRRQQAESHRRLQHRRRAARRRPN
jgi:amino acid adenylation domain-containing protein